MAQYNINPPDDYRRDTGMGTVLAVLLVLALVAFLIWALAFGGFNSLTGAPVGVSPGYSTTSGATMSTPSSTGGTSSPSGTTGSAPSGAYGPGGTTPGTGATGPARP